MISEREVVRWVARGAPWLAPAPSAYFVARASMGHLAVPVAVAIIIGLVIESLGLVAVYTTLWLAEWNGSKRKTDPSAPTWLAAALGGVYLLATVSLTVVLEVAPGLSVAAPAIFPLLAVVGAANLVLMARQEQRELDVQVDKVGRKAERQARRQGGRAGGRAGGGGGETPPLQGTMYDLGRANAQRATNRAARMAALGELMDVQPDAGPTSWARQLGVSRTTVYSYLEEIGRDGHGAG